MSMPEQPSGRAGGTDSNAASDAFRTAPPTVPGVISAPPRKQGAWRIVLGILILVSSFIAIFAALMRASTTLAFSGVANPGSGVSGTGTSDPVALQAIAEASAEANRSVRMLWIALGINGVVAAGLVVCAILLLCKCRAGARALFVLSALKCVTVVLVGVAAGGAQFHFLRSVVLNAAAQQPSGGGPATAKATTGLVWFTGLTEVGIGLCAMVIPVATLVVLVKPKIRQEVAAWGKEPESR